MQDFIFINDPTDVGKTTLAKKLHQHYQGVYIEQHMIPDFYNQLTDADEAALLEEKVCWEAMLAMAWQFHDLGFKHIIILDYDDVRAREIPSRFKGNAFICLKLISSDFEQNKQQMLHCELPGLTHLETLMRGTEKIMQRALLPNERLIDIAGKTPEMVFDEAVSLIDTYQSQREYTYQPLPENAFDSWVQIKRKRMAET
ncbi:MAG TPA: hypothetical protein PK268_07830 [Enterococcus sp.]|nr:hypothetical protein [Enterococcus sp.]HPR81769.1 hypothetical protein [Enterococcus sp.]